MHSSEIIETLYIKGSLKRISVKRNAAGDTNWTYDDGTYSDIPLVNVNLQLACSENGRKSL